MPVSPHAHVGSTTALHFIARLLRYVDHWREERRLVTEHADWIEELEAAGDLDALLEAVGATREELSAFAISPVQSDRVLDAMMARVGVSREQLSNIALDDLRKACHCCASWKQCRRWLADSDADAPYREFCPNAALLERLTHPAN